MKWFRFARANHPWVAEHRRANDQRRKTYRPHLDALEERLPPGDVLLGAALGASWFASGLSLLKVDPLPAALASTEELPTDRRQGYAGSLSALAADLPSPAPAFSLAPLRSRSEHGGAQADSAPSLPAQVVAGSDSGTLPRSSASMLWAAGDPFTPLFADPLHGPGPFRGTVAAKFPGLVAGPRAAEGTLTGGGGTVASVATEPGQAGGSDVTQPLALPGGANDGPYPGAPTHPLGGVAIAPPDPVSDPEAAPVAAGDMQPKSASVHALFDLSTPTTGPFPSDRFTVRDRTQNTDRRVNLPLPDLVTHRSDYEDTQVLNTLDGFNMQPRLSVPFDGPIDVNTVSSQTVFLVSLGDTLHPHEHRGEVVGINQVVWDVATTTLHAESDALLAQHTRYALIVTNGIQNTSGRLLAFSRPTARR